MMFLKTISATDISVVFRIFFFLEGVWTRKKELKNNELKSLSESLPEVIMAAKADTTTNKYWRAWSKWLQWCKDKDEVISMPADPFIVAIYLNHLLHSSNNKGALTSAFYGLRWGHHINGYHSPTDHPFVQLAYEGAVRLCEKKPKNPKDPITSEIIKAIVLKFNTDSIPDLRFLITCVLGFFGFFRIDELLSVKLKDISLFTTHMEIFLSKSKCDQHRDGKSVYISRIENNCCPVKIVEKFFSIAKISITHNKECFLIPRLVTSKKKVSVHLSKGISYSRAREIFKENIDTLQIQGNFGLHSLRSGGASAAASNEVNERLISKHGRWSSDRARNSYILDSVHKRLEISKNLGL